MTRGARDLLAPFSYQTFFVKTVALYLAFGTAFILFADLSEKVEGWKKEFAKEPLGLLVSFVIFTFLHLLYQLILRAQRLQIERRRSSPAAPRHRGGIKHRRPRNRGRR